MLHLLVVEDDQDTATSSAMLLRLYGHEVEVAADGPSAMQAARATQPDVVLLDLGLPKMDGWQVAQQIRQLNTGKRPLLIAVSGYGHEEARRRSQDAGIDLHLIKPVDPEELEDILRHHANLLDELKRRAEDAFREGRSIAEESKAAMDRFWQIEEEILKPYTPRWDRGPDSES
jgi:CheY-like chemotaxis protein